MSNVFNCEAEAWCIVQIMLRPVLASSLNVANTWFADKLSNPLNWIIINTINPIVEIVWY